MSHVEVKISHSKAVLLVPMIIVGLIFAAVAVYSYSTGGGGGCASCGERESGGGGTTTTLIVCGNGVINSGEQCEYPSTSNNAYCSQTTSSCSGNQTGTRDSYGNCGSTCQCSQDPFTYSCVKDSCGAECSINSDCANKCVGDVRYYNGQCGSTSCACTFTTENCNGDGWYNTTEKQWVDLNVCKEKEQQKQEYRNYYCTPSGCTFEVTEYRWADTGNTRNKPDGTECGTNSTSCLGDYCLGLVHYDWTYNACDRLCAGGLCGHCDSCSLTTETCNPSGCCDATCSASGCGLISNDANCESYCDGNVRYFSGDCDSSCGCNYQSEDCDDNDGWYNLTTKQWVNLDTCREKEQLKQEHRDYSCSPSGCSYLVTGYQWIDTGRTRNKPDGTNCGTNSTSCLGDYCLGLVHYDWTYNSCNRLCTGGLCGTCNTCRLTTETCSPLGCCDASCDSSTGCELNRNDGNCDNYCSGSRRYYSGSCEVGCSCNYLSEDCNSFDGWYNLTEKQWVSVSTCKEKEQLKQEQRDYSCDPNGCTFVIKGYQWVDTGNSRIIPVGTFCGLNTTSCRSDYCSNSVFYDYTYHSCDRTCDSQGICGICETCHLETETCESEGCCDGVCSSSTGCSKVANNRNCPTYCSGDVRYFSGSCGTGCSCNYQSEDCGTKSGWYNTITKKTAKCDNDPCKICQSVYQEYRQYYCTLTGCKYSVSSNRWLELSRTDVVCKNGQVCTNGNCVYTCEGFVRVTFLKDPYCPGTPFTVAVSGLSHCTGRIAYLREDSCDGRTIGQCRMGSITCGFKSMISEVGNHNVVACVDKNLDGDFSDSGEQVASNVVIDCHSCMTPMGCNSKLVCNGWCSPLKTCLNNGETCG